MPKNTQKSAASWLWLSVIILLLDQGSKYFVTQYLTYGKPYVLLPFFNFWLKYNTGASYSLFDSSGGWQVFLLAGIAIIVSVVLVVWLLRTPRSDWMTALALSLILGGAVGNLMDRLRFRYVIDFLDFHIGAWHFATFNVADAAISIGAAFLVIRLLFIKDR